jgi:transcription elongation factor GreA-like protein/transcription elongation GreA/GreB family factor
MSYLKDFRDRIQHSDYPGFLKIWEEYCYGDEPDVEEIVQILEDVKRSELARPLGIHVERMIPLWRNITDPKGSLDVLRLVLDIQTTMSDELADLASERLQAIYKDDPLLSEKFRMVGLRNREKFQSCIRNFELLTHLKKGNFVFHTAGWGTGEILDVSFLREEASFEFEYVIGTQHLSFEKGFKTLGILPTDHFLARRFGQPDALEAEARENPTEVIRLLLRDLGPKTASEIKDELADLVIPVDDWNRWWQTARSKVKKDTLIASPKELKESFFLRKEEVPHEIAFHKALEGKPETNATIQMIYTFLRDFPETLKNQEFKASLNAKVSEILSQESLNEAQKLQLFFFLEDLNGGKHSEEIGSLIAHIPNIRDMIQTIEVVAFQKRALHWVGKARSDATEIFLDLLFVLGQNMLRDYIVGELDKKETRESLKKKLGSLLIHPITYPEIFVWYFQKVIDQKSKLPYSDKEGRKRFFEGLLVLLDHVEEKAPMRDLAKKIIALIGGDRYKIVRDIFQSTSQEEAKELLLLATKCSSLTDHDIKILHSLAEVVHPSLARLRKEKDRGSPEELLIWTTKEGYQKVKERITAIATVETIQNAKEIEVARGHGDLRENAEFKAALERRDRLQSELKFLSDQIARARIISPEDVPTDEVGIGSVVRCADSAGKKETFILLGPWDADPEKHILSFQSKLAQAMKGKTVGETFDFQGEVFTISDLGSFFDL